MRSVLLSSAVVAAAITLLGQMVASRSDKSPQKEMGSCTVAGRVVTAAEGNPLKSAHVMLTEENARREPRTYGATTDASGVFVLRNVVSGRYKFFAMRTGYVTQQYQSHGEDGGAVLWLQPRQQVGDVLFRLMQAAVITGHVSDEDEEPMAGIQVLALRRPSEEEVEDEGAFGPDKPDELVPAASARTDDRGEYRIFGLAPGEYYLRATESVQPQVDAPTGVEYFILQSLGTEYAAVYYPGVLQRSQAETISLRPGDETQIDFAMRHTKTVEISGRVLSPDGKPANAMVQLQDAGLEDYFGGQSANTDADGNFRLKSVPPGSYILLAYQQAAEEDVYRPAARQKLQVGNENVDSILLALSRGTSFAGRVIVEGPSPARPDRLFVSLRSIGGDVWGYGARMKPDGGFEINGVEDGNYAVVVHGGRDVWYIKAARLGSTDILEHGLQVEKGTSGTLEIVVGAARAQLEGSVVQDDKPAIGARVRISADPETPYNRIGRRSTTTDQNGHFVLIGIPPGKYRVTAKSPAAAAGEVAKADPQSVTLAESEHKTIELKLVAGPSQ